METFEQKLQAISDATGGNLYNADWEGGTWMHHPVETQDSLAAFESASDGWAECSSKMVSGTVAGLPFISWEEVQVRKGDKRDGLTVIDFGDRRIAIREFCEYIQGFVAN